MISLNFLTKLSRLALPQLFSTERRISTNSILFLRTTPCLFAEPLKKKKRLDPAIIKAREERKKKKLEKQIRRLEKHARQLKPIEECETPLTLVDNPKRHARPMPQLSYEVMEQRVSLEKQWAKYKLDENLANIQLLDRIVYSQQKALDELRKESEELYQEAIQIDPMLLNFKAEGPSENPPIENYSTPDGDYQDVSKKWN